MRLRFAVDGVVYIRQDNIDDLWMFARLTEQRTATRMAERPLTMLRGDENSKLLLSGSQAELLHRHA